MPPPRTKQADVVADFTRRASAEILKVVGPADAPACLRLLINDAVTVSLEHVQVLAVTVAAAAAAAATRCCCCCSGHP